MNIIFLIDALSTFEVANLMSLHKMTSRKWHIQAACATHGEGIFEAMKELSSMVKENKKKTRWSLFIQIYGLWQAHFKQHYLGESWITAPLVRFSWFHVYENIFWYLTDIKASMVSLNCNLLIVCKNEELLIRIDVLWILRTERWRRLSLHSRHFVTFHYLFVCIYIWW